MSKKPENKDELNIQELLKNSGVCQKNQKTKMN